MVAIELNRSTPILRRRRSPRCGATSGICAPGTALWTGGSWDRKEHRGGAESVGSLQVIALERRSVRRDRTREHAARLRNRVTIDPWARATISLDMMYDRVGIANALQGEMWSIACECLPARRRRTSAPLHVVTERAGWAPQATWRCAYQLDCSAASSRLDCSRSSRPRSICSSSLAAALSEARVSRGGSWSDSSALMPAWS
jgi:hypothetical protein